MNVLAFESSCDETGVALVAIAAGGVPRLLADALHTQADLHADYGGVVPELASRDHIRRVVPLARRALADAGVALAAVDVVAYTRGPGLAGALLVGAGFAAALAAAIDRPTLGVHHLEGHLLAPFLVTDAPTSTGGVASALATSTLSRGAPPSTAPAAPDAAEASTARLTFPFIALLVSGGHTQLMRVDGVGRYALLGETIDDAAGEAFDKTAKLLGLGYPGGAALARLAEFGDPTSHPLPRPLLRSGDLDFSFAGLKTAVATRHRRLGGQPCDQALADLAAATQAAIVDVLVAKSLQALRNSGVQRLVVAGGVAANRRLRDGLQAGAAALGATLHVPPPALCTDNGAMIATAAAMRCHAGVADLRRDGAFDVQPRWALDDAAIV